MAPIRICDNGGWTDTWFAERGKIFNIAVHPYAEVQIEVTPHSDDGPRIVIHAENYGERYVRDPDKQGSDRHPSDEDPERPRTDALMAEDFTALGSAMIENTDAQ
jgi:hypothetical protein